MAKSILVSFWSLPLGPAGILMGPRVADTDEYQLESHLTLHCQRKRTDCYYQDFIQTVRYMWPLNSIEQSSPGVHRASKLPLTLMIPGMHPGDSVIPTFKAKSSDPNQ